MKSAQVKQQLFDDLRDLLKAQADTLNAETSATAHPDTDELAAFFYGKSHKPTTAAHLAACQNCAEEITLYRQSEQAATDFKPNQKTAGKIPAKAWQMIRDWQDNSFARPKPHSETVSAEMLTKFSRLIASRKEFKPERKAVSKAAPNQVPVIVLNREGDFRGIEMFEKSESKSGEVTLKHLDQSGRFDKKELHALLSQDSKKYDVESFTIERNKVRVGKMVTRESVRFRAKYFIIED
jgi:hypothetical protein